jgi:O-antigen/teichoic acid export membrane protein
MLKRERQPSFTKNVFFQFAQQVSTLVLGIASSIIIARGLGPTGKGIVNTLTTFTSFVGLIALLGIHTAVIYYSASGRFTYKDIMRNLVSFLIFFTVPLAVFLTFLAPFLKSNILKGVPLPLIIVALLLIPLNGLSTILDSILRSQQRFKQIFITGITSSFSLLVFYCIFIILLRLGVVGGMLAVWLTIPLAITLYLFFLNDILKPEYFKPRIQKEIIRELLSYGLKCFLSNILWVTSLRVDVFFVNYFLKPGAVGIYMTGVTYTELIRMVPTAISGPLFPRVSSLPPEEADKFAPFVTRSLTLILIPACFIFYFLAPVIIPFFYGKAFIPSVKVVGFLLPGIILWSYMSQFNAYVVGKGYPQVGLYGAIISSLLTFVLDITLIPKMGIAGAAIASSIAYASNFLVHLYYFCRLSKTKVSQALLPTLKDIHELWGTFALKFARFRSYKY